MLEINPIDFEYHTRVRPICIPPLGNHFKYTGAPALVAGWGKSYNSAGAQTRLLQKVEVPVLDSAYCGQLIGRPLSPNVLCGGEGKKNFCNVSW